MTNNKHKIANNYFLTWASYVAYIFPRNLGGRHARGWHFSSRGFKNAHRFARFYLASGKAKVSRAACLSLVLPVLF